MVHVFADKAHQIAHLHHGTAHHKVVFLLFFDDILVRRAHIGELERIGHGLGHFYFLADGVEQMKLDFGKENGERYAGKTAAGADVHHLGAGTEADDFGYAQGVEHVMRVEIVDVLAGDDVDLGVPITIKGIEGGKLLLLLLGELGKIAKNLFHQASFWGLSLRGARERLLRRAVRCVSALFPLEAAGAAFLSACLSRPPPR